MSALLVERLVRASIEGGILAGVVALICKLLPSLPPRHRAALWWLAAAKLLVALLPVPPLELPLLPSPASTVRVESDATMLTVVKPLLAPATGDSSAISERWIAGLWAAGLVVLVTISAVGALRARRLRRSGRPLDDAGLAADAASAARKLGLARAPEVLLVPGLSGPLVTGLVSPSILLPDAAVTRLSAAELAMAIEHEIAHVARRDLWLGLIPAAACRIFFFHPVAWWIEREYAIAREAACDEAVVSREGADPFVYGSLLLRLATGRPASTAALSPRSMLRRRLEMIERTRNRKPLPLRAVWALIALAAAGFVPMKLVARDTPTPEAPPAPVTVAAEPTMAPPAPDTTPAPATNPTPVALPRTAAPPAPGAAPRGAPPAAPTGIPASAAPRTALPPTPAAAPAPAPRAATTVYKRSATPPPPPPADSMEVPEAPKAPAPPPPPPMEAFERCLDLGNAKDTAFVITNGDSHTMCGDLSDIRDAEHARGNGDDVVWFRVDGQSYVIRDRGTVTEAREAFRAQSQLGEEQSKVGDVQSAIGEKQSAIAERQAQLAESQEKIAKELSATDRNLDVQDKMNALSRRMDELNRQMQELSEQQSELGMRQGELGNKMMLEGSAAQRRLTEILESAMKNGRAQKID